jgi:hypothetical protein
MLLQFPKDRFDLGISTGIFVEVLHTEGEWSHPLFTVWQGLFFRRGGQQDANSLEFAQGPWTIPACVRLEVYMGA